jgi:Phosphotransferase enzyme family
MHVLVQTNTSIPIPKILDWSDDASNAIGSEYIIMEHAAGVQLHQRWLTMAGDQQIRCINAIYQKVKEMVDIEFPAYGSLYFVDTPLDSAPKQTLNQAFCIGPHCGAIYWNCKVGESRYYHNTKPNQGSCKFSVTLGASAQTNHLHTAGPDLTAYCDGLIDTGLSRIPLVDPFLRNRPPYHGFAEAHLRLLEYGRAVIKKMSRDPRIQDAAAPTLFHPDLHKRNIFVSDDDPTVITAIIDWQSSSIEPTFWYADEIPDFARPVAHPSLENQLEPNSERCAKAFDVCSQFLVPKLSGPRLMDEALFRPFRYCYRTWVDGAVAFRHELIETSRRWKELGLAGSCPFPTPTPEELAIHKKEYRMFEAAYDLRNNLSSLLNTASDG